MKTLNKYIILIIAAVAMMGCNEDDSCALDPLCFDEQLPNSEFCNYSVVTCYGKAGQPVGGIYDTRFNSTAPRGDDWKTSPGSTLPAPIMGPNWTSDQLGQVFGIAIDNDENIYLASTDIYHLQEYVSLPIPSSNPGIFSPTQIFKCSPPTYMAVPYVTLPVINQGTAGLGVGNIAYDKANHQLFATNLEDGNIYRINLSTGYVVDSYDPWAPDNGSAGMPTTDERVWGVGVNYENGASKVYFPRVTNTTREIFSIKLNPDGSFPSSGNEVVEINGIGGNQETITDIAFSSNKKEMLISERGRAHNSEVFSYSGGFSGWSFNKKYFIGGAVGYSNFDNSAGGIDFAYAEADGNVSAECDTFFWATGDFMGARALGTNSFVYGLEGISYSGNNAFNATAPTANIDTDIFIDFDGLTGYVDRLVKGGIGDVEVFDCTECLTGCE